MQNRRLWTTGLSLLIGAVCLVFGFAAIAGTAATVTEFPAPVSGLPNGIVAGPDGALWFTQRGGTGRIGRVTVGGSPSFSEFVLPSSTTSTEGIAVGPDGALWFAEVNANKIGRILPGASPAISEFAIPTAGSITMAIAQGPDGAMWFGEVLPNKIGRITTGSSPIVSEFAASTGGGSGPTSITAGPDGALWFTSGSVFVRRISADASSTVTSYLTQPAATAKSIAAGPDGTLWFTGAKGTTTSVIDRFTASSTPSFTEVIAGSTVLFDFQTGDYDLENITLGPDGAMWFIQRLNNRIGRITTGAVPTITEYAVPTRIGSPNAIAAGPDGAMWFTEATAKQLGRVTIPTETLSANFLGTGHGQVTSSSVGSASLPGIVCTGGSTGCAFDFPAGNDVTLTAGAMMGSTFIGWSGGGCVGVAPCTVTMSQAATVSANFVLNTPSDVVLVSALLPTSRSVQIGTPATFFGTMINASTATAGSNCTVAPTTSIPATFFFQTTDAATNGLTGMPNTPVTIAPGAAQSFILALTPQSAFAPTDVAFSFTCSNASPAGSSTGLNTLLLSGSATATPDVIVLAATLSSDGIVNIAGVAGTGAFAVATVNVGAGDAITASADSGAANLPVTATICQTNPASGQCLSGPAATAQVTINTNATPTFTVFVKGNAAVPFQPAANRIFVKFKDSGGAVRGSTSVAVRTQ